MFSEQQESRLIAIDLLREVGEGGIWIIRDENGILEDAWDNLIWQSAKDKNKEEGYWVNEIRASTYRNTKKKQTNKCDNTEENSDMKTTLRRRGKEHHTWGFRQFGASKRMSVPEGSRHLLSRTERGRPWCGGEGRGRRPKQPKRHRHRRRHHRFGRQATRAATAWSPRTDSPTRGAFSDRTRRRRTPRRPDQNRASCTWRATDASWSPWTREYERRAGGLRRASVEATRATPQAQLPRTVEPTLRWCWKSAPDLQFL